MDFFTKMKDIWKHDFIKLKETFSTKMETVLYIINKLGHLVHRILFEDVLLVYSLSINLYAIVVHRRKHQHWVFRSLYLFGPKEVFTVQLSVCNSLSEGYSVR